MKFLLLITLLAQAFAVIPKVNECLEDCLMDVPNQECEGTCDAKACCGSWEMIEGLEECARQQCLDANGDMKSKFVGVDCKIASVGAESMTCCEPNMDGSTMGTGCQFMACCATCKCKFESSKFGGYDIWGNGYEEKHAWGMETVCLAGCTTVCIKDTKEYGDEWDSSMVTTTKCGCKMGMIGPVHALISECGAEKCETGWPQG